MDQYILSKFVPILSSQWARVAYSTVTDIDDFDAEMSAMSDGWYTVAYCALPLSMCLGKKNDLQEQDIIWLTY